MAAHVTLFSSDDNAEFTVHEHLACAEADRRCDWCDQPASDIPGWTNACERHAAEAQAEVEYGDS